VVGAGLVQARAIQRDRYREQPTVRCNGQASGRMHLRAMDSDARSLLDRAAESLALSARAYHRVVKVARTIADLAGTAGVGTDHVAEALRFRPSR
jgi:magnesium chelatase family protein